MSTHTVQMRWRDLDGLGHVNHTVVLTYLEEGRDEFLKGHGIGRDEYVVGRCEVTYNDELDPADGAVEVQCEVGRVGGSSLETTERIVDRDGRALVEAAFGLVLWDPARRASRPLTAAERVSLERGPAGGREEGR